MRSNIFVFNLIVLLCVFSVRTVKAQPDIYVSFSQFGEGNSITNSSGFGVIGESMSAYIWIDENLEINTGAFLNLTSSNPGIVSFTNVEVFNPDIVVANVPVNSRWEHTSPGMMTANEIYGFAGFNVTSGTGIVTENHSDTEPFSDNLHDAVSDAFLFARVDFEVVGLGSTNLQVSAGAAAIVHDGAVVDAEFDSASIESLSTNGEGTFFGLTHQLTGQAVIVPTQNGGLQIGNLGTTEDSLVVFLPTDLELWGVEFEPITASSFGDGSTFQMDLGLTIDGQNDPQATTVQALANGLQWQINLGFGSFAPTDLFVQYRLEGEVVFEESLPFANFEPWTLQEAAAIEGVIVCDVPDDCPDNGATCLPEIKIIATAGNIEAQGTNNVFVADTISIIGGGSGNNGDGFLTAAFSSIGIPNFTITGEQLVEPILHGDLNCDGLVNLLDVSPFIDVVSSGEFDVKADVNQDGLVNLLDVSPFVEILSGG
ncbi:MAG: dockerin type I domain-containing protein [Planctomycetota bacterium]